MDYSVNFFSIHKHYPEQFQYTQLIGSSHAGQLSTVSGRYNIEFGDVSDNVKVVKSIFLAREIFIPNDGFRNQET